MFSQVPLTRSGYRDVGGTHNLSHVLTGELEGWDGDSGHNQEMLNVAHLMYILCNGELTTSAFYSLFHAWMS